MFNINYKINGEKKSFVAKNLLDQVVEKNGKYYYPITKEQNDNFKKLLTILRRWIKICNYLKIEWWICAGTLLGCLRNESFIPWDDDIDVCFLYKDYHTILELIGSNLLKKLGVEITKCFLGFRLRLENTTYPFIDLFVYDNNKKFYMGCGPVINLNKYWVTNLVFPKEKIHEDDLFPLLEAKFEGLTVKIPKNALKYIKNVFGKNCITHCVYKSIDIHQNDFLLKSEQKFTDLLDELITDDVEDNTIVFDFLQEKLKKSGFLEDLSLTSIIKKVDKLL